jgi:hypothetical protein
VSLVPGNHDVNIIDRTNTGRLDLPWRAGQLRKLRGVLALDTLAGNRTHLVHRASGGVGPLLRDYLRQGQCPDLLRELANRGTIRGRREMTKAWEAISPLVSISLRERIGLALINAPNLVAVLAPHSRRVIVLHGDRLGIGSAFAGTLSCAPRRRSAQTASTSIVAAFAFISC